MSGRTGVPPRAPMGPEPLSLSGEGGRRERGEQIEAGTRAVYPGSGRDGRVKPYSCLVVLNWGARELGELAAPSVWLSGCRISEPRNPLYVAHGPPFIAQRGHRQVST